MIRKMMKYGACIFVVLSGFHTGAAMAQQGGPPPALVRTEPAFMEEVAPQLLVPGTVVSVNDSNISAEVSGRVVWVAPEGTYIEAGEPVARIDDTEFRLILSQREAQVKRLEAQLAFQRTNFKRMQELASTSNTTLSNLEQAESQVKVAEQDLAIADIQRQGARFDLDRTVVSAPFPGRVVSRMAQLGEFVNIAAPLVRLVDTDHLEISVQAPLDLASIISAGDKVTLQPTRAHVMSEETIRAIIPVGDTFSRTMEIRVGLGIKLAVGTAVQVGLPSGSKQQAVLVPRDALVLRESGTFVFAIDDNDTAEMRPVRTGLASGRFVSILSGIEAGEKVVVRGGERLSGGRKVRYLTDNENTP